MNIGDIQLLCDWKKFINISNITMVIIVVAFKLYKYLSKNRIYGEE